MKCISINIKIACLWFTCGVTECINRWSDLNIDKSSLFNKCLPAFARKTTGNSGSPEINIPDSRLWDWFSIGNIGELQIAARS